MVFLMLLWQIGYSEHAKRRCNGRPEKGLAFQGLLEGLLRVT